VLPVTDEVRLLAHVKQKSLEIDEGQLKSAIDAALKTALHRRGLELNEEIAPATPAWNRLTK